MKRLILTALLIVTANTESQLRSRTWAELGKWMTLAINSHWFDKTATTIKPAAWFDEALKRNKKLTLVDKANVLSTSRLWREVIQNISKNYSNVKVDYLFVDNAAMKIISNPSDFDVILTENMFGDIITDEASVITGSLGMLPSASVGKDISLFEPIHGSYPQAAGKNIANPMAMILSSAMMIGHSFNMSYEERIINRAVNDALNKGIVTEDINKNKFYKTNEVGDWIANRVHQLIN